MFPTTDSQDEKAVVVKRKPLCCSNSEAFHWYVPRALTYLL